MQMKDGEDRLAKLRERLVTTSATCKEVMQLERVSNHCLHVRHQKKETLRQIEDIKLELVEQQKEVAKVQNFIKQVA